jgi:hypothetical protein
MPTIEHLLTKLSKDWSVEPGRNNSVRASLKKGFIVISLFDVRMNGETKCNFVAETLATNNTLLDQVYFANEDECIDYAEKLKTCFTYAEKLNPFS